MINKTIPGHAITIILLLVSMQSWARWGFDWDEWFAITSAFRLA